MDFSIFCLYMGCRGMVCWTNSIDLGIRGISVETGNSDEWLSSHDPGKLPVNRLSNMDTTHQPCLLDQDFIRTNEVWLVEKKEGAIPFIGKLRQEYNTFILI